MEKRGHRCDGRSRISRWRGVKHDDAEAGVVASKGEICVSGNAATDSLGPVHFFFSSLGSRHGESRYKV